MSLKEFIFILDLSGFAALTDVHGRRTAAVNQILCSTVSVNNCIIPKRYDLHSLGIFKVKNILDKIEV